MTRRKFTASFKTKVVLEAIKERMSMADLAQKYELHPQMITNWKREFLDKAETVFSGAEQTKGAQTAGKEDQLLKIIGQQKVEIDFLKKVLSCSLKLSESR